MQRPTTALANPTATAEVVLTDEEIKRLAQLLNVLMEVDFYQKRKPEELTND